MKREIDCMSVDACETEGEREGKKERKRERECVCVCVHSSRVREKEIIPEVP